MERDTFIAVGLAIGLALLQWRVKDMPTAVTTGGFIFALGLFVWPFIPVSPRFNVLS